MTRASSRAHASTPTAASTWPRDDAMALPGTRKATGLGLLAVLLWAGLAALTAAVGTVPPLQLAAMTFAIGTLVGLVWSRLKGESLAILAHVPLASWCLGVYGLLAFH